MTENVIKTVQTRDAEGNFLFRKEWLANYAIIDGPGKYEVTTTSNPNLYDPAEYGEEGNPRYIVNVKAVLREDLAKVAELLHGKEFVKADDLNDVFMNGNIWVNDGVVPELPMKRENITVTIDYVTNREGEEVLRITGIQVQPVKKAPKIDLDALFAGEKAPEVIKK